MGGHDPNSEKKRPVLPARVTFTGYPLEQFKGSPQMQLWEFQYGYRPVPRPSRPLQLAQQRNPLPHPVLGYILAEMSTNAASLTAKGILTLNVIGDATLAIVDLGAVDKAAAYALWIEQVNQGHDWDHKQHIFKMWGKFQPIDFSPIGKPEKFAFSYDIWSNIHYGYVGLAAGFTELELIEGSNAQSLLHNGSPDPPSDVASIRIGFSLRDAPLSLNALLQELYDHRNVLSGEPVK